MLRLAGGLGLGFAAGYCMPKIDMLTPYAMPVEDAIRTYLPLPKPTLVLTYFDIEGVAEPARLTARLGGISFTDERVQRSDWPSLKPKSKFGKLPMLTVDGETYAQSGAILRFVGRLSGMYPSDPRTALSVDELCGLSEDLFDAIRPSIYVMMDPSLSKREAVRKQTEMRKEIANKNIPEIFGYYERQLNAQPPGAWFVGEKPTIADMMIFSQLRWLTSGKLDGIPTTCLEPYPRLKSFFMKASSHPEVERWYASKK